MNTADDLIGIARDLAYEVERCAAHHEDTIDITDALRSQMWATISIAESLRRIADSGIFVDVKR